MWSTGDHPVIQWKTPVWLTILTASGLNNALSHPLRICVVDVCWLFQRQKTRKGSGPDVLSLSCLRACANQLAPIFTHIFNQSLELCEVPSYFKHLTIIPVPKKPFVTGLSDNRPDVPMS